MNQQQEQTFPFTLEELAKVIEQSFILGKMYASDELHACDPRMRQELFPVYDPKDPSQYERYVAKYGIGELHSVDAKMDVLTESLRDKIFDNLRDLFV